MDMTVMIVVGIIVVAIPLWLILRSRFRTSVAESFPDVTYVDETLLDLVRTSQFSAAQAYYQKHTQVTDEEAERVIYYFRGRDDALMLMVRLQDEEIAPLFTDAKLLDYINKGRIFKAHLYYAEQTGVDIQEAEVAVYALAANPTMKFKRSKSKRE